MCTEHTFNISIPICWYQILENIEECYYRSHRYQWSCSVVFTC